MKNFLVTGGAGFIGSSLVDRLLQTTNRILLVDNFNDFYDPEIKKCNIRDASKNDNCHIYSLDIEDKDVLNEVFMGHSIDCVVHLAARAGVRPSIDDPVSYYTTNVLGTLNILELMKRYSIPKLIFASSSSVYGNNNAGMFHENLKLSEPISPYAATKLAGEQMCYVYSKLYNISTVCLRFFTVYGPRQRPDLAIHKFTRLLLADQPIPMFGDGTSKRDYTYIDDIVDGIVAATEYDKTPYEIINLGGGEPVTLRHMIEVIENSLGKRAIINHQAAQPGDVEKTICTLEKAEKILGYRPRVTFIEGVARFIDYYQREHL
jgi:UDP-glucuronate 4-epimerase